MDNLSDSSSSSSSTVGEDGGRYHILNLKFQLKKLGYTKSMSDDLAEVQYKIIKNLEEDLSKQADAIKKLEKKQRNMQRLRLKIKTLDYDRTLFSQYRNIANDIIDKRAQFNVLKKKVEALKVENAKWKELVKNKLILEEQLNDLKSRLTKYKLIEKELFKLQCINMHYEHRLNEWCSVAREICSVTDSETIIPEQLKLALEKIQQRELALAAEKIELESNLKRVEFEARMAKLDQKKFQTLLAEFKSNTEEKEQVIAMIQRSLNIVTSERDGYKSLLDSEKFYFSCSAKSRQDIKNSRTEYVKRLETICEQYHVCIENMQKEIQTMYEAQAARASPEMLMHEIENLKCENERLRERNETLTIQLENSLN